MSSSTADRTTVLQYRIRWIVNATISYNVIEAIVAITAGSVASSVAAPKCRAQEDERGQSATSRFSAT